jgi:hypothetical protein
LYDFLLKIIDLMSKKPGFCQVKKPGFLHKNLIKYALRGIVQDGPAAVCKESLTNDLPQQKITHLGEPWWNGSPN